MHGEESLLDPERGPVLGGKTLTRRGSWKKVKKKGQGLSDHHSGDPQISRDGKKEEESEALKRRRV